MGGTEKVVIYWGGGGGGGGGFWAICECNLEEVLVILHLSTSLQPT